MSTTQPRSVAAACAPPTVALIRGPMTRTTGQREEVQGLHLVSPAATGHIAIELGQVGPSFRC